jgi:hypothetical protein
VPRPPPEYLLPLNRVPWRAITRFTMPSGTARGPLWRTEHRGINDGDQKMAHPRSAL